MIIQNSLKTLSFQLSIRWQ